MIKELLVMFVIVMAVIGFLTAGIIGAIIYPLVGLLIVMLPFNSLFSEVEKH